MCDHQWPNLITLYHTKIVSRQWGGVIYWWFWLQRALPWLSQIKKLTIHGISSCSGHKWRAPLQAHHSCFLLQITSFTPHYTHSRNQTHIISVHYSQFAASHLILSHPIHQLRTAHYARNFLSPLFSFVTDFFCIFLTN